MRKKICSRCSKIIGEGTQCSSREKRSQIIRRDRYVCQRCFIKYKVINTDELTVHHILSRKNHPELMYEDSNLICLCATCNKQLGTKDKLDFEWDAEKYAEINDIIL